MKIESQVNTKQVEQVDLSITITMRVAQWDVVAETLRDAPYNWSAKELANGIVDAVENYQNRYEKTFKVGQAQDSNS